MLHQALLAFTEEAAFQLAQDASQGAEVPFEVVEAPGARAPLYCYRPLTGEFIGERQARLADLPTHRLASRALEGLGGLDDYLAARGEPRVPTDPGQRADAALQAFLNSVFSDSSEFVLQVERFETAYRQLEAIVYEGRALAAVIVPVLGLQLESDELVLDEGYALVRGETLADAPREALWGSATAEGRANVIAVFGVERAAGDAAPVTTARVRFRRLLTALRLLDTDGVALGPVAWSRTDAGPWQLVPLGGGGRPAGRPYLVVPEEEDELRGFCNLVARRTPGARQLGWALARFEMGCERVAPFEALTDFLLGLRALLEPEGAHSGRLAGRLSVICALPGDRAALAERVAHSISLERAVVAGIAPAAPGADRLVDELALHLRALLRDVLCGHLDADLVAVAERLLDQSATVEPEPAAPGL